jgi:hypothetical protein
MIPGASFVGTPKAVQDACKIFLVDADPRVGYRRHGQPAAQDRDRSSAGRILRGVVDQNKEGSAKRVCAALNADRVLGFEPRKSDLLKINAPRNDLKVAIDGIATPTPFGFGDWLAMTKGAGGKDGMMSDPKAASRRWT